MLIVNSFKEGQEQVKVPVSTNQAGDKLKELVESIRRLKQDIICIEEVYAIRSSLSMAKKLKYIDNELAQTILAHYKTEYSKITSVFDIAYNKFDLVADKIGEIFATSIIYFALETFNPTLAFFGNS